MKEVRATGNTPNDNTRRFHAWVRQKLADGNYSQKDAAAYIGISRPEFTDKLNFKRGGFNLKQAMGIVDYFGESETVKNLF